MYAKCMPNGIGFTVSEYYRLQENDFGENNKFEKIKSGTFG